MTRRFLIAFALLLANHVYAAAPSKTITLSDFSSLSLNGPIDVHVVYADTAPSATITAEKQSDLDAIDVNQANNTLSITYKNTSYFFFSFSSMSSPIRIDLVTKPLTDVISSGSGSITLANSTQDVLNVSLNGSGDLTAGGAINEINLTQSGSGDAILTDLNCKTIRAKLSGSGDATLAGQTETGIFATTGSGDINAQKLAAQSIVVSSTGSGDAMVNASLSLEANTNGSGDITYVGKPKTIKQEAHGSGSIATAND